MLEVYKKYGKEKSSNCKRTKDGRLTLSLKRAVCNIKKSKFIKEQEASGLLCSLGIKTPLNKITLLVPLLF